MKPRPGPRGANLNDFAVLRTAKSGRMARAAPFQGWPAPGPGHVKVKEIVLTAEEARREVIRLNALNADKGRELPLRLALSIDPDRHPGAVFRHGA